MQIIFTSTCKNITTILTNSVYSVYDMSVSLAICFLLTMKSLLLYNINYIN